MQPLSVGVASEEVLVTAPQPSVAVTRFTSAAGITALQPSVSVAGQLIEGAVTSTIRVIVCVQVALLLQPSVAL